MTIVMMPSEFVSMARGIGDAFRSGGRETDTTIGQAGTR
jgi:hypothetical protein